MAGVAGIAAQPGKTYAEQLVPCTGCRAPPQRRRSIIIVSGGRNHIRDYVAEILEERAPAVQLGAAEAAVAATAIICDVDTTASSARLHAGEETVPAVPEALLRRRPAELPKPALLKGRIKAMNKTISVAQVVERRAAERGISANCIVVLRSMDAEGPDRRERPEIEIALDFCWMSEVGLPAAPTGGSGSEAESA